MLIEKCRTVVSEGEKYVLIEKHYGKYALEFDDDEINEEDPPIYYAAHARKLDDLKKMVGYILLINENGILEDLYHDDSVNVYDKYGKILDLDDIDEYEVEWNVIDKNENGWQCDWDNPTLVYQF